MLDQSFSPDNFRRILDLENRKGVHLEEKLGMTRITRINKLLKKANEQIRFRKKAGDLIGLHLSQARKEKLKESKETDLKKELEAISKNVSEKHFKIDLTKVIIPGSKDLYTVPKTPEHFFTLRQLQQNISRPFGVKQSNRHTIVGQVISLLGGEFPKFVIRTDIKDFYESIQHDPLLQRISRDNLLSPFSRKILSSILKSYKTKSGSVKGLPRGIGVSAYLAELYMRDVDNEIKELKGVTYYARYVDDIVVIFTPSPTERNRQYLQEIKEIIEKKHMLRLNSLKTEMIDLRFSKSLHSFDYLGYTINFGEGPVKVSLTATKLIKYQDRITKAFDNYTNLSKIDKKQATRILVKRIRFLSGNTRLTNNKENILIGIYYSNRHLSELSILSTIDGYLKGQIHTRIPTTSLKTRLLKHSFALGYREKRFSPFKTNELSEIMTIWKE